ncbi:hypothetical protein phiOC_p208 [Ochrobactrum phage vB_OspM_OC]|nr:hypothetical protein phiOC_p208 [Ochrobactrum phage vB_OspM_OC]
MEIGKYLSRISTAVLNAILMMKVITSVAIASAATRIIASAAMLQRLSEPRSLKA